MRDRDLYAQILGLSAPWTVIEVKLDVDAGEVEVHVAAAPSHEFGCPTCGVPASRYDQRTRRWRHLDTCQFRTVMVGDIPRVKCPEHGVLQVNVPWSEPGSRFTALFEALAIDWLREASKSAVARRLGLSWDEADAIMRRAVGRGMARRGPVDLSQIGIDETSYQKRHEYVTVVVGRKDVIFVADDRKTESIDSFYESLSEEELAAISVVTMDMWPPYIKSTRRYVPDADSKIAFDKFHVAAHLGEAVDRVRRKEHGQLLERGDATLTGTKHLWLQKPENIDPDLWEGTFTLLKEMALKTARAWALKETAMSLWDYVSRAWAKKAWTKWLAWAGRSQLEPMKKVARMIRKHLQGIINAIVLRATNARSESINAKIQRVKRMACGFRNRDNFRIAIYFHLGGLDLYPSALSTHTKP